MIIGMFEKFSLQARQAVTIADEEARMLNPGQVDPEHILLGLIDVAGSDATSVLISLGISPARVREHIEEIMNRNQGKESFRQTPLSARAKKVLKLSQQESIELGHPYIGTEHILLGLLQEGDGPALRVLTNLGLDLNRVRQQVIQIAHSRPTYEFTPGMPRQTEEVTEHGLSLYEQVVQLRGEVARLKALVRQHDIEPPN